MSLAGQLATEAAADNDRNTSSRDPLKIARDIVIVGAGFAGLYALHKMRGLGFSVQAFEAGADVGGTWYWNRYPGARCDVASFDYQFSFSDDIQRGWTWSERYPSQPEILRYLRYVATTLDLRKSIAFDTKVVSATYQDQDKVWLIKTDAGDEITARYCIMGVGCLSAARDPDITGKHLFKGDIYYTSNWPHEGGDLKGKRVGVIGTGSSGVQAIPVIAQEAAHLYVFQRTPNYVMPARNRPLTKSEIDEVHQNLPARRASLWSTPMGALTEAVNNKRAAEDTPAQQEEELRRRLEMGGFSFLMAYNDVLINRDANEVVAEFARRRIRSIVKDPEVADKLTPRDHPIGSKRSCLDTNYYETYNRSNVTLVDIRRNPIARFTHHGIVADREYEVDAVVFATGFDAVTGPLLQIDIRGKNGLPLRDKWRHGPRAYLGIMINGFPNLFTVTGPGSPSVLSNVVISIEQHVEWIADLLLRARAQDIAEIEADKESEDAWVDHVNEVANRTLYPQAASWYMGANIPGKPRVFLLYAGGVGAYKAKCDEVARNGYQGVALRKR